MVTVRNPVHRLSDGLYKAMQAVLDALYNAKDSEGNADLSAPFHDLLPKRQYADYYKLIKHPRAMNPVQNHVRRKTYTAFADFVKDCAQIFHNAKLYNRHDSVIYQDAETLEKLLKEVLDEFVTAGTISEADAELPDLGPLPPPSPDLSPRSPEHEVEDVSADEEEDEEDEDEEDEEDDDEEDTSKRRRSSGRGRRVTRGGSSQPRTTRRKAGGAGSTSEVVKDEDAEEGVGRKAKDDPRRKRGRPPRVDTPMEIRIKNILKALRKLKDDGSGQQRITAFEKLPEKKEFPEYFQEIKSPIALDIVRKNVKRRVYKTLDQFVKDMELMFANAKAFNEDDSQLYKDAVMLQKELRSAVAIERAKTDEDLAGGDDGAGHNKNMRIPLDNIEHKGDAYRVGDWIHIVNPNDPNKPTVAQIFRTWKDLDGRVWLNACWYYRPEQTVHWVEKKFFPDEVVKTGQYRDHSIDEVLGKCFVMFFTRYSRGRPKGIDENSCPIYVCESRYNETEKHFNKIKTWKSCIPDEVHNQDYELDPFEKQRTLKKVPSPILHLLPPDAKESDPLPDAKMGIDNAPPVIGAVFKRARRDTDSPPPEPTPPPPVLPVAPPPPPRRSSNPDHYHETMSMTQMYKQAHMAATVAAPPPPQTPAPPPLHPHQLRTPGPGNQYAPSPSHYSPATPLQRHPSNPGLPGYQHATAAAYQAQQQIARQQEQMKYNPPAAPVVFTLPESVTHHIPEGTAERFLRDEQGQLLWFAVPPLDNTGAKAPTGQVGHSVQYLARRKELEVRRELRTRAKKNGLEEAKRKREQTREDEKQEAKRVLVKALGLMAGGNTVA